MLFWRKTFVQRLARNGSPRIEGGSSCGVSVWFKGHSSWRSFSSRSCDRSHEMGHIIGTQQRTIPSTESMREVPRRRRLVLLPRISGVGVVQDDPESIASQAVPRADVVPQRRALSQVLTEWI